MKSSGLQITMWSIRFENIETIIKEENIQKRDLFLACDYYKKDIEALKKDKDFEAAYGTKVDIVFFAPWEGLKNLVGVLESHDDEAVWVRKIIKGKEFKTPDRIERKLIAVIRPHIDF